MEKTMECEKKCLLCHCPIKYKYVQSDHGCCQKHHSDAMPIRCIHCTKSMNLKSVIYNIFHQGFDSSTYSSCNMCLKDKDENVEIKEKTEEIALCEYCTVNNYSIIKNCKHKLCEACNKKECPICTMFDSSGTSSLSESEKGLVREANNVKVKAKSFIHMNEKKPELEISSYTLGKKKNNPEGTEALIKLSQYELQNQNKKSNEQNAEQCEKNDEQGCKKKCKKYCCIIS